MISILAVLINLFSHSRARIECPIIVIDENRGQTFFLFDNLNQPVTNYISIFILDNSRWAFWIHRTFFVYSFRYDWGLPYQSFHFGRISSSIKKKYFFVGPSMISFSMFFGFLPSILVYVSRIIWKKKGFLPLQMVLLFFISLWAFYENRYRPVFDLWFISTSSFHASIPPRFFLFPVPWYAVQNIHGRLLANIWLYQAQHENL